MSARDEALAEFRRSREGARSVNPFRVFEQGWDAHDDVTREQLAVAWDEGSAAALAGDCKWPCGSCEPCRDPFPANPYRVQRVPGHWARQVGDRVEVDGVLLEVTAVGEDGSWEARSVAPPSAPLPPVASSALATAYGPGDVMPGVGRLVPRFSEVRSSGWSGAEAPIGGQR